MKLCLLIQLFLYLNFTSRFSLSQLSCKNENNTEVDWYVVLKYPNSYNYIYISSNLINRQWTAGEFNITNDNNMIAVTLLQIYKPVQKEKPFHAFYSDSPPNINGTSKGGHLKGVLSMGNSSGFWLIHSIPKFPAIREYIYEKSQLKYGQSFICVSINISNFHGVINQLLIMYSTVYNYNVPEQLKHDDMVNNFVSNYRERRKSRKKILTLNQSTIMIHFAKSNTFGEDLYAGLVAPEFKQSLFVETWRNGNGKKLESNCSNDYKVYNVTSVKFPKSKIFNSTTDHSKWAVIDSDTEPYVCIGDINRMKSQFKRGGGTLCLKDTGLWKAFKEVINKYEPCEKIINPYYLIFDNLL